MHDRIQLTEHYKNEAGRLLSEVNRLKARGRGFVAGEIASFLGIVLFIALITIADTTWAKTLMGAMTVVMFALYVVVRNRDVRNSRRMAATERLHKAYSREADCLNGRFDYIDDGQRYVDPKHPFTYDLDIFGKESLYQRINRTVTTHGADRLAYYLSSVSAHETVNEIEEYHDAINLLADKDSIETWRMRFLSHGVDGIIDTCAIARALPHLRNIAIASYLRHCGIKVAAWVLTVGLLASIVAAVYGLVSSMLPIAWCFVNCFIVQALCKKHIKEMQSVGLYLYKHLPPLVQLMEHSAKLDIPANALLAETLAEISSATASFKVLNDIAETLILRGNGIYLFFTDAFGLRGLFLVNKFCHWRQTTSDNLEQWLAAVANLDTLVSMAQMRSNHPEAGSAKVENPAAPPQPSPKGEGAIHRKFKMDSTPPFGEVSGDFPPPPLGRAGVGPSVRNSIFSAHALWHPFLGEKAVRNDFTIADRNFYIVTGANMAGKSTFLRAVGVNYLLAMNGMPVFAESLTVSRLNLFTSMRTSDDLAHGISYFNAELQRLQQLTDSVGQPTLIILDEILKGTNSLDKLNGSRMFLRAIAEKPVSGIIATHDLELSKMDEESPRFHNHCFEIELGSDITYSYKITPGVARNQNATYLLEKILQHPSQE